MKRELERWPQFKKMYIAAFDEMLEVRKASGKTNHHRLFTDGEGIMKWWTGQEQRRDENQISFFDDEEDWTNRNEE